MANHYARILHETNLDGRGYAFPYDDVTPDGGDDVSGFVSDPTPSLFLVTVGGGNASSTTSRRDGGRLMRRAVDMDWSETVEDAKIVEDDHNRDLEKGDLKLLNEYASSSPEVGRTFELPPTLQRLVGPYFEVILLALLSSTFHDAVN